MYGSESRVAKFEEKIISIMSSEHKTSDCTERTDFSNRNINLLSPLIKFHLRAVIKFLYRVAL